jgi:hypothetical protein
LAEFGNATVAELPPLIAANLQGCITAWYQSGGEIVA